MKKNPNDAAALTDGRHQNPLPRELNRNDRDAANAAHKSADEDMQSDAELTATSPKDDLDEGELARLGDDRI